MAETLNMTKIRLLVLMKRHMLKNVCFFIICLIIRTNPHPYAKLLTITSHAQVRIRNCAGVVIDRITNYGRVRYIRFHTNTLWERFEYIYSLHMVAKHMLCGDRSDHLVHSNSIIPTAVDQIDRYVRIQLLEYLA